ncbi:hypothetical protein [Blastomonas sp. AAP53]|uniref:hypothetical protein n=1 Tax=Blastomonas sp. AAP53 TaxID=1248760 RepID=UPI0012674E2E|nr:hypothetical protein [Blastomonas sp. AAP53]
MTSPFDKLLELGFKGADPIAHGAVPAKVLSNGSGSPAKPKKRAASLAKSATATKTSATSRKKARQSKKKANISPGFVNTLPKAHLLTENGFKKRPLVTLREKRPPHLDKLAYQKTPAPIEKAGAPTKDRRSKKAERRLTPIDVEKNVKDQIRQLSGRSMGELKQQWLNLLIYMEKYPEKKETWERFHSALVAEWGRRNHIASEDPDHFIWPSTVTGPGDKSQSFSNWYSEGMLVYLGYHVGNANGATEFARKKILDVAFKSVLPPINDPGYVRDWGRAGTASRLKRLSYELARFAKNAKRKSSADMSSAVADWEADLRYLYLKYYVGKFGFGWPNIS